MKATFCSVSGLIVCLIAVSVQAQSLTHSYTFKDLTAGNVADGTTIINQATGVADATLYLVGTGTATVNDNHTLTLNGINSTNGAYIDLPSTVIGDKTSITVESWVTANQLLNYSRVFDWGSQSNVYFMALTLGADGNSYVGTSNGDTAGYKLTTGQEYLLTTTRTGSSTNFYVNGALVSTIPTTNTLDTVSGSYYLGRSHWTDRYADATFNEFNVYDGAMGDTVVLSSYKQGAGAAGVIDAHAVKLDTQIGQAVGYWNGTLNSAFTDRSGQGHDLTNHTLVFDTSSSSAIFRTLASNGVTFSDGKNGNGYAESTSTDFNIGVSTEAASNSISLVTRVNMSAFNANNDFIRYGASWITNTSTSWANTTYALGTSNSGDLTFFLHPQDGNLTSFYLKTEDNTNFKLQTDTWYDLGAVFDAAEGTVSLYVFDTVSGSLLASYSQDVEFDTLNDFTGGKNLMLFESPANWHGINLGTMDFAGIWNMALTQDQIALFSYSVPEPSTWLLMILGIVGLTWIRSRKK